MKIEHSEGEKVGGARRTGVDVRDPLVEAFLERARRKPRRNPAEIREALREIGERCSKLPVLDNRSAGEILGYDEHGLPH
jgi:antitoxin VapB